MSAAPPPDALDPRRPLRAWLGAALFAAGVAALVAVSLQAMRQRAEAAVAEATPPAPMPVRVAPLRLVPGYDLAERFVGRVEPARDAALAFERPALVAEVLADEGDAAAPGQVLARLDTRGLARDRVALAAQAEALRADLALARATLERRRALSVRGHDTAQALDEARFAVDAVGARVRQVEAQIAAIDLDLEKSELRAPFAGVVAARLMDEGDVAAAGAPVLRLQETGRPRARVGAPAGLAATLAPGAAMRLEARGGEIAGVLRAVSPEIEPATRTRALLIDLPPEADLASGEILRAVLPRRIEDRGAWAPLTALVEGERGLWAFYLALPDGEGGHVARREAAEALHVEEGRVFVRGAFADGALLVTEGAHRLTQGQAVAPLPVAGD